MKPRKNLVLISWCKGYTIVVYDDDDDMLVMMIHQLLLRQLCYFAATGKSSEAVKWGGSSRGRRARVTLLSIPDLALCQLCCSPTLLTFWCNTPSHCTMHGPRVLKNVSLATQVQEQTY
jgi:hypothetical protein